MDLKGIFKSEANRAMVADSLHKASRRPAVLADRIGNGF